MEYLKEFHEALGLDSEFDKVVASAAFIRFFQVDVLSALDKYYESVTGTKVVFGTSPFTYKLILGGLLKDKVMYLLSITEDFERLDTEPIIDNGIFIDTAIEYVKSHRIPYGAIERIDDVDDIEITDELYDASIRYLEEM